MGRGTSSSYHSAWSREGCQSGRGGGRPLGRRPSKDQMVPGRKERQEKIWREGDLKARDGGWVGVTAPFAPRVQLLRGLAHKARSTRWGQAAHTMDSIRAVHWDRMLGRWVQKQSPPLWGLAVDSPHHTVLTSRAPGRLPLAPSGGEGVQRGAP